MGLLSLTLRLGLSQSPLQCKLRNHSGEKALNFQPQLQDFRDS